MLRQQLGRITPEICLDFRLPNCIPRLAPQAYCRPKRPRMCIVSYRIVSYPSPVVPQPHSQKSPEPREGEISQVPPPLPGTNKRNESPSHLSFFIFLLFFFVGGGGCARRNNTRRKGKEKNSSQHCQAQVCVVQCSPQAKEAQTTSGNSFPKPTTHPLSLEGKVSGWA